MKRKASLTDDYRQLLGTILGSCFSEGCFRARYDALSLLPLGLDITGISLVIARQGTVPNRQDCGDMAPS
jgi:hypothetical protein